MADNNDYTFELFISYATNPDYSLARGLESFLETFHNLPTPENLSLTPLRICVDGSDFHTSGQAGKGGDVESTIEIYLAKSKELLVLCSRNARNSVWVDQEIRWFLANGRRDAIRVALTQGEALSKLDDVFPQAILDTGLHKRIAYDFRGVHKRARQSWEAVRDFDDERTRLAADLYDRPAGEIRPIWFREQRRQARNRTRFFIAVTLVLLGLLAAALYFYFASEAQRKQTLAEAERTRRQFYVASMNLAERALNEGSVPLAQQLLEAQRPREAQGDLRDFDWSYLSRRSKAERSHLFAKDIAFESVSVSADGSLVAAGGRLYSPESGDENPSHYVYVWSLQSGELKHILKGHAHEVTEVKFSPVGLVLASGSNDALKIWNAESGTELHSVSLSTVDELAYSPDGSTLAVSKGLAILLFNTTTWEQTGALPAYNIDALAFSPNGKLLAAGGFKKVQLWDVVSRKMLEVVGQHEDFVISAAWSAETNLLITGGRDGVVMLWDMNKKKQPVRLQNDDGVASLALTRDGKLLAVGTGDQAKVSIVLWDVPTATRRGWLKDHSQGIGSLDFTPSGDTLVSVGEAETIRVWDVKMASFINYFGRRSSPVWALDFSPDGKILASGDQRGLIQLRSLEPGASSVTLNEHTQRVAELSFNSANLMLASAGWDGTVRIWEPLLKSESQLLLRADRQMSSVAFAPDGSKLAATNCNGNIYLWDSQNFEPLPGCKQNGCPSFLAWSPDSQHFVTGGGDLANQDSPKSVFIWRVGDPNPIKVLKANSSWPTCADFSPDGKYLVTGGWDGEVILWDVASGAASRVMRGHSDLVTEVMFSPSGKIVASSSMDKSVRIWDTVTGQERVALTDSKHEVTAIRFHPSGKMLATGSADGSIVLWIGENSPLDTFSPQQ